MVKHVKIGGEKRPVKFGFAALMEFTDALGYTMADLDNLVRIKARSKSREESIYL